VYSSRNKEIFDGEKTVSKLQAYQASLSQPPFPEKEGPSDVDRPRDKEKGCAKKGYARRHVQENFHAGKERIRVNQRTREKGSPKTRLQENLMSARTVNEGEKKELWDKKGGPNSQTAKAKGG